MTPDTDPAPDADELLRVIGETWRWLQQLAGDLALVVADVPSGNPRKTAVMDAVGRIRARMEALRKASAGGGRIRDSPAARREAELVAALQLGLAMVDAQSEFFERKRKFPLMSMTSELRSVQDQERRFRAAARAALTRQQRPLPGMEGGDTT